MKHRPRCNVSAPTLSSWVRALPRAALHRREHRISVHPEEAPMTETSRSESPMFRYFTSPNLVSFFDSADGQSTDEIPLRNEHECHGRDEHDHASRRHRSPVDPVLENELGQSER